jgi:hypothetical protein
MGYSYGYGLGYTWRGNKRRVTGSPPATGIPVNITPPVVSGTTTVGQTLSATNGSWTNSPTSYIKEWYWVDNTYRGSGNTYLLLTADYNKTMKVALGAVNGFGTSAVAESSTFGPIAGFAPVNTVLPVISGGSVPPKVAEVLTGSDGTWTGAPTPTLTRQWKRAGAAIGGATVASYTLVSADLGTLITYEVTATNAVGAVTAASAAVGPIAAAATLPTLSAMSAFDFSDIFVWGQVTTDVASGTMYAVVCAAAAVAPSAAQIKLGQDGSGAAAASSGNQAISSVGVKQLLLRGLTANTSYKVYFTHEGSGGFSNVVNTSFLSDVFIFQIAHNGSSTGLTATNNIFTNNVADPQGGTNAVRWADNNDSVTGAVTTSFNLATFFNGVNKFHFTYKQGGGADFARINTANLSVGSGTNTFQWSTGTNGAGNNWTGATGTGGGYAPFTIDMGAGWRMWSAACDCAGADLSGAFSWAKGMVNNVVGSILRNGTNITDLYNVRVTRAGP